MSNEFSDPKFYRELSEKILKKFEKDFSDANYNNLFGPDNKRIPNHKVYLKAGEMVVIKNYTFEIKYVGDTSILLEPVSPVIAKKEKK